MPEPEQQRTEEPADEAAATPEDMVSSMAMVQTPLGKVPDFHTPVLREISEYALVFIRSDFFRDAKSLAQGMVKTLAGRELGIGPFKAMKELNIVEGKLEMSANLMAAMVQSSGQYRYRVREHSNELCRIEFFEVNPAAGDWESVGVSEFTIEDARLAGLVKDRSAWVKFPKAMLFARAVSQGCRWYCPAVFGGAVYAEGEIIDVADVGRIDDSTGEIIQPTDVVEGSGRPTARDVGLQATPAKLAELRDMAKASGVDAKVTLAEMAFDPEAPTAAEVQAAIDRLKETTSLAQRAETENP